MRTSLSLLMLLGVAGCGGRSVGLVDLGAADGAAADAGGLRADSQAAPEPGGSCGVRNTCCECRAFDRANPPPPVDCAAICEAPLCDAQGIAYPFAYKLGGQCLLGADLPCSSDAQCAVVNDCCNCLALPTAVAQNVENQCPADCFVGQCTALTLAGAKARCVQGRCELSW